MDNEYAMIWTTTESYMPGTNAVLNALEFYGNKGIDVFILTWGDFLTEEYKNSFPKTVFEVIDPAWWPGKKAKWYLVLIDFEFALGNLFEKYKVILLWGADVCLANYIGDYFKISQSLDKIIMGTNEHGAQHYDFRNLSKKWPYKHTADVPFADVPLFIPKNKSYVLERVMEYQTRKNCAIDRMNGLNYALRDCGEDIFPVPGEVWVHNVPTRIKLEYKDNKIRFANATTELLSFHRKYWEKALCEKYFPINEICRKNKMLFNKMYNFLNRDLRVVWTENLEVWDG